MQIDYKKLQSIMPFGDLTFMGIPPDYEATILDFINDYRNSKVLNKSLLTFIVCNEEFMPIIDLKLFTIWSIRSVAEHSTDDEYIFNAINIIEKYVQGLASIQDLYIAIMLLPSSKDQIFMSTRKQLRDWFNKRSIVRYVERLRSLLVTERQQVLHLTFLVSRISRDFGSIYEDKQLDYLVKYFKKDAQ